MSTVLKRCAMILALLAAFAAPSDAALIDIVVVGTFDAASANPIVNPFGILAGDKWVMKATYDNTSLFFRADAFSGVVASVDPGVNPGTGLDIIIPHAGGVPNPLVFDEADHINIGFSPTAEIHFDGPSVANPGNFRNFEIHTEYLFFNPAVPGNQVFHLDTFFTSVSPEADIFNITEVGAIAAQATSPTQLVVVVNDMTADAGGPYVFDSANLSLNLNGISGGGSGFPQDFDWEGPGGALANSPGPNIAFGLAESGLVDTTDTDTIDLVVTEDYTDFASAASVANTSYANGAPTVSAAAGNNQMDLSISFTKTFGDVDLLANAVVVDFETVDLEFLYLGTPFLAGAGNVDLATLTTIFGAPGVYEVEARATDLAGLTGSLFFDVQVGMPACAVGANAVANCSFETGFTSWITKDMATPFVPLAVSPAGTSITGFVPWLTAPTDGISSATHGFDGGGPDTIEVSQDVVVPPVSAQLTFDYRAGWDMFNFVGSTLDRTFEVVVEPTGGGAPLQTVLILTAAAGTVNLDTGMLSGNVDLSAFAGQAVRLKFEWTVPEAFTGPAAFEIDNIVLAGPPAVPSMGTWGRLAVMAILASSGLWTLGRKRRR